MHVVVQVSEPLTPVVLRKPLQSRAVVTVLAIKAVPKRSSQPHLACVRPLRP